MKIDVSFRILGEQIPLDHGYQLYGSLSHLLPPLHNADWLAIHPINGLALGRRILRLTKKSHLQLRLPPERLPDILPLAGKRLLLADQSKEFPIRLGVPEVYALKPASSLHSRCVVIKVSEAEKNNCQPNREMFLKALHAQMDEREIGGEVWIDDRKDKQGRELSRRILQIKDKKIVGYTVRVSGLNNDDDSIKLQEIGLGGRQRMGCGIFVPLNIKER
jgi:CRISPR-associated protein Cas6